MSMGTLLVMRVQFTKCFENTATVSRCCNKHRKKLANFFVTMNAYQLLIT